MLAFLIYSNYYYYLTLTLTITITITIIITTTQQLAQPWSSQQARGKPRTKSFTA